MEVARVTSAAAAAEAVEAKAVEAEVVDANTVEAKAAVDAAIIVVLVEFVILELLQVIVLFRRDWVHWALLTFILHYICLFVSLAFSRAVSSYAMSFLIFAM